MRSVVFATVVIIGLLAAGLSSSPPTGYAFGAEPGDGTPAASPGAGLTAPSPDCTTEELTRGDLIEPVPPGEVGGIVAPWGTGDNKVLYIAMVTLLPDSCLAYRYRDGAVALFVQEGTVVYTAQLDASYTPATPDPEITRGDSDASDDDITLVALGVPTTLHANDWITQRAGVWFGLRNGGDDTAIIAVAVYAVGPWDDDGNCNSVCRRP